MWSSIMMPLLYLPKKTWAKAAKNREFVKSDGPANGLACMVTIHKSSKDGFYLGD